MAFDCVQQRKPLFADLFKTPKQAETPSWSSSSGSASSWTQSLLSCDSSSSGFSTPLYSDLGSSESDDGDFIAELTRQMAECMLQEEDDEGSTDRNSVRDDCQASSQVKNSSRSINTDTAGSSSVTDDRMPPLQVYELKNQPPVSKRGRKKRAKAAESAQFPKKALPPKKTEHRHLTPPQYAGRDWGITPGINGSGMQALFLGRSGPGSRTGFSGTGYFLPRVAGDPAELRKKSGCPMVLIPTRVMQVLEGHFNRVQDSTVSPNGLCQPDESCGAVQQLQDGQSHEVGDAIKISENNNYEGGADIMQLPKEWTY